MKKNCSICKKKFLSFLNLGKHPCADTFLKSKNKALKLKKYPLIVGYCSCSHLSSIYPIKKFLRYEQYDYSYTSNNSIVSRSHFKNIAEIICSNLKLNHKSFIVEAGSNDGTFLKSIKLKSKAKVLGVDPSKNISRIAVKQNIQTLTDYFNLKSSKKILKKFGNADVIYGANVFNHVDDLSDFLRGAKLLLRNSGKLILEVPDLNSLIDKTGFDTIYHEHRHYFSENSMNKILNKNGFFIENIQKINYMSGSLRVFASKTNIKLDKNLRKVNLKEFNKFKSRVNIIIKRLKNFTKKYKFVVGIGAATKGNTLLNCCQFSDKDVSMILDKSNFKINKFTPGSGIKIVDENIKIKPDAAIILPWNITKYLLKRRIFKNKIKYISIPKIINKL